MTFAAIPLLQTLFPRRADAAAAAAVTMLANLPPPQPPGRLHPALRAIAPHLSDADRAGWLAALAAPMHRAGITAPRCIAAFLGQCAVESSGFRALEEDLSYSAARLCQVWPHRFPTVQSALACAVNPERLANRVYAGRMGNGDEASGDGWRFRGRGLIQLTGRATYQRFAQAMNLTIDQAVAHAATRAGAADTAVWYWSANNLNSAAASWSIDTLTRKINGGLEGAAERTRLCDAALHAIGA